MKFPFEMAYFQGRTLTFREGIFNIPRINFGLGHCSPVPGYKMIGPYPERNIPVSASTELKMKGSLKSFFKGASISRYYCVERILESIIHLEQLTKKQTKILLKMISPSTVLHQNMNEHTTVQRHTPSISKTKDQLINQGKIHLNNPMTPTQTMYC